ncbi:hypothetical protein Tco_0546708 [Tanacetum coccineum]
MGDENPIHTLRDYPKPSHKGYRNTIELPIGNNVVPFRSKTIRIHHHMGGSYYSFPCSILSTGRTAKLRNDILMFQQHHGESLSEAWTQDLALYDNESWNDPRDFAKLVKAIALPQDFPSTSDRRLIKLENQVQCLMEAHLAPTQPTQVNKVTTSCEICSGPHDTLQSNLEGLVSNFMASQDARLSKFEADFKQQQSEMTNKVDIVLKAITDRIAGTLPGDTVKNPKLSTYPVLFARSYPTEDPQCSTHIHGSINTITIHPKQQNNSRDSMAEEEE